MKYDILTIGSITTDIFVRPCQLPIIEKGEREYFEVEVGEKIKLDDVFRSGGGSAANSAAGFSSLGLSVCPIGVIGDDEEGEHIMHKFKEKNIETDYLVVEENHSSSISFILNAADGRRTVLHHRATSSKFNQTVVEKAPCASGVYVGHLYPDSESILYALPAWKQKCKGFLAWNPGKTQFKKGLVAYANILKVTDILILNVEEAEQFTGIEAPLLPFDEITDQMGEEIPLKDVIDVKGLQDVRALAKMFLDLGVGQVIITDGRRGSQGFDQDGNHYFVRSLNDVCVSTLGAGDAFSVGVVSGYIENVGLREQLLWGSGCATNVVKQFGAQHGYVDRKTLEKKIKEWVK